MPSLDCPVCDGTGYVQEEDGAATIICAQCEGTGVVFVDRQRVMPSVMSETELTKAMITAAMAKAEARVCVGLDRRFAFPHPREHAIQTCTPKGRCKGGWVVSKGSRESW